MDEKKIEAAIKHFKFAARPSSGNSSKPATIKDINNLIEQTSKLIIEVVKAMDK